VPSWALEILKDRGEVERSGAGKKNDPYLYCLFGGQNSLLSQCHPIGEETKPFRPNGHANGLTDAALDTFGGRVVKRAGA